MSDRKAYTGLHRRLVLAFDLGTTFSGVSFAVLDPGKVPKIQTVSRYPGQETSEAKVPTILYYDKRGHVVAAGAEEPQLPDDDSDDGWEDEPQKLEWFKLLLRPQSAVKSEADAPMPTPRLPASKTIVGVYADFYAYLFQCASAYIQEAATGKPVWEAVKNDIHFVLTHPNGWGGAQQGAMRRAAIQADLIPDNPSGRARVTFASEGEASLHYCLGSDLGAAEVKIGKKAMIIDAGGGTVDISTYTFTSAAPVKAEESAIPASLLQGSVIVRQRAEDHFRGKLRPSNLFSGEPYVQAIVQAFDKTIKKTFKGLAGTNVRFSSVATGRDHDASVGIRNGAIKVTKEELCGFFDPAVTAIVQEVRSQRLAMAVPQQNSAQTFFLVGGFAANEYLFAKLRAELNDDGCSLFRPDAHTNKAVAEGAISFYIDHHVSTRIARFNYGAKCNTTYKSEKASHSSRAHLVFEGVDGTIQLDDYFYNLLDKGTRVSETTEFRKPLLLTQLTHPGDHKGDSVTFYAHPSATGAPDFVDDSFFRLCTVTGSLEGVPVAHKRRPDGRSYYEREYDVVLSFGLTELTAQIAWKANGAEQRSPATIIYDDDFAVTVAGA